MDEEITWSFPLRARDLTNLERLTSVQGSFGYRRSYYYHQGVDLYVRGEVPVFAVETGIVVAIEDFTGPPAGHDHWLHTKAVLVEGPSGVVCYGEVWPVPGTYVKVGTEVLEGTRIADVRPVLIPGMERPDIFGHSRHMLHLEWYDHGQRESVSWHHDDPVPKTLRNPTALLQAAWDKMKSFE